MKHLRIGTLFGVEIGLHVSWLLIAALITVSLGAQFRAANPDWSSGMVWGIAVVTGVLFFAGLVAHELSHALVAKARGLPIHKITLFALGGVAQIEREAEDAKTEFLVAVVGPVTSCVLGVVLLVIAAALGWDGNAFPPSPGLSILVWLGYINIGLGIFNMVPGFPLDGGRVLRAIIWWKTGNGLKATRIAASVGQVVGWVFIAWGVFRFFAGAGFGGLWLALIGWFLLQAASASYTQYAATALLRDLKVRDLMSRDCLQVDGNESVQRFVDEHMLRTAQRCFIVAGDGQMQGMVTPHDVRGLQRDLWPQTPVSRIMRPIAEVRTVSPDTPVIKAMEVMSGHDLNQLPVVQGGALEGMISRAQVLRVLQSRAEVYAAEENHRELDKAA